MDDYSVKLTHVDRMIMDSYCQFLDGLSHYLGKGYEIVLHSLEDLNHSVIKIVNGYHTGRKAGAPITDLALSMLERMRNNDDGIKDIAYLSKNKDNEPLWSTTISVKGEHGRVIGLLCINFYMNTPLAEVVRNIFFGSSEDMDFSPSQRETFVDNVEDLVQSAVAQVRDEVLNNPAIPSNQKNKEIVRRLQSKGVFNLKDAVVCTARLLNISRNTVYMHVRSLRQ